MPQMAAWCLAVLPLAAAAAVVLGTSWRPIPRAPLSCRSGRFPCGGNHRRCLAPAPGLPASPFSGSELTTRPPQAVSVRLRAPGTSSTRRRTNTNDSYSWRSPDRARPRRPSARRLRLFGQREHERHVEPEGERNRPRLRLADGPASQAAAPVSRADATTPLRSTAGGDSSMTTRTWPSRRPMLRPAHKIPRARPPRTPCARVVLHRRLALVARRTCILGCWNAAAR